MFNKYVIDPATILNIGPAAAPTEFQQAKSRWRFGKKPQISCLPFPAFDNDETVVSL